MNYIKLLLIACGLILFGMLAFPLIAFVWNAIWYLFWIALIGLGGYIGYKWLTKSSENNLLENKKPQELFGFNDVNRALEDFKRKHLTK